MQENVEQKSINNAISSYLMIIASWFFLINKDNKHINNDFVKKHTKSALIIHLLFILTYIIFIYNWLFKNIIILSYWLNIIVADILFIFLFSMLLYGMYKASKSEYFNIWWFLKASRNISLDINNDNKLDEKDKLTIVASYIPFIWYIIWWKYENKQVQNILTLNMFISVIITLIYILWYSNVSTLLILIYIVYSVFVWVNLFTRNELVSINLPYYFSPNWKIELQKNLLIYIKNYISWNFKWLKEIIKEEKDKKETKDKSESININKLEKVKIPEFLIYIPIINLFLLFIRENNNKLHIRNGLIITLISILMLILIFFGYIPSTLLLLLLFPICFGLWKLEIKYYKMPYIYEIFLFIIKMKNLFLKSKQDLKEKHNEVNEVNLKVK